MQEKGLSRFGGAGTGSKGISKQIPITKLLHFDHPRFGNHLNIRVSGVRRGSEKFDNIISTYDNTTRQTKADSEFDIFSKFPSNDVFWKDTQESGHLNSHSKFNKILSQSLITALTVAPIFLSDLSSKALAEETVENVSETAGGPLLPGINIVEGTILVLPIVLYALFTVYRTNFNRNAKFGDFMLLIVTTVILGNIISILFLKIRIF